MEYIQIEDILKSFYWHTTGPAIPIVAISVGITHEQYGTDEQ